MKEIDYCAKTCDKEQSNASYLGPPRDVEGRRKVTTSVRGRGKGREREREGERSSEGLIKFHRVN